MAVRVSKPALPMLHGTLFNVVQMEGDYDISYVETCPCQRLQQRPRMYGSHIRGFFSCQIWGVLGRWWDETQIGSSWSELHYFQLEFWGIRRRRLITRVDISKTRGIYSLIHGYGLEQAWLRLVVNHPRCPLTGERPRGHLPMAGPETRALHHGGHSVANFGLCR